MNLDSCVDISDSISFYRITTTSTKADQYTSDGIDGIGELTSSDPSKRQYESFNMVKFKLTRFAQGAIVKNLDG